MGHGDFTMDSFNVPITHDGQYDIDALFTD